MEVTAFCYYTWANKIGIGQWYGLFMGWTVVVALVWAIYRLVGFYGISTFNAKSIFM